MRLSSINGGSLRNAIPREAFATITVNKDFSSEPHKYIKGFLITLKDEFGSLEPDIKIEIKSADLPNSIMDAEDQIRLLKALKDCPHGVIDWSKEMENLVETSTNLASVKFLENNIIKIATTQRSSVESSKHKVSGMVEACLKLAGAEVVSSDGYPGWKPNISSEILKITRSSYFNLFGNEPKIRAIHAGLECGLIYEKNKLIDMISFGPTIRGAHTPEEMLNIESTKMFWDLLINVIDNIPEKQ